jgi:NAD-dependent SIR2 family protein deacetylase
VLKISSADYAFILTGAGVSAENGIPGSTLSDALRA